MATGLQNTWVATAADNDDADTNINLRENQAPSTINNAARAIMAAITEFRKDTAGSIVTGGTSTAYTLTTNEGITLADGVRVRCRVNATNGAAPTLNVDSTGAVAIQTVQGTAIPVGALFAGGIYAFTYYSSSSAWIVEGAVGVVGKYVGEVFDFAGSAAPAGSLLCYGQAISRTTYAALFAVLSTTYGAGDESTTFNLPDIRGRVVAGQDDMGGTSANRLTDLTGGLDGDTLGDTGGEETHALSTAELASHSHAAGTLAADSNGAHTHTYSGTAVPEDNNGTPGKLSPLREGTSGLAAAFSTADVGATDAIESGGAHTHTVSGSSAAAGSGTAHNNVQPTIILNKCIFAGVA